MSSSSKASERILSLLDENSFVEVGALVTARATSFNLTPEQTPSDGVVTGYGTIFLGTGRIDRRNAREEDCGSL